MPEVRGKKFALAAGNRLYDCRGLEVGGEVPSAMNAEGKPRGILSGLGAGLLLTLMAVLAGGAGLRGGGILVGRSHLRARGQFPPKIEPRGDPEQPARAHELEH